MTGDETTKRGTNGVRNVADTFFSPQFKRGKQSSAPDHWVGISAQRSPANATRSRSDAAGKGMGDRLAYSVARKASCCFATPVPPMIIGAAFPRDADSRIRHLKTPDAHVTLARHRGAMCDNRIYGNMGTLTRCRQASFNFAVRFEIFAAVRPRGVML